MRISKSPIEKDPAGGYWLKSGKEYVVLEVGVDERGIHFRVESEDATPVIVDATRVVVVDGTVPPNWLCKLTTPSCLSLAPKAWLEPQFWTRYFDGSREEIHIYRIERDKIFEASGVKMTPKVCECPGCGSGTHPERHGPCIARHSDAPYRWERVRPTNDRERLVCPACLK